MSTTLIQIEDTAFKNIIKEAFEAGANIAKSILEEKISDKISEEEVTKIFGYNKRKIATLRKERVISFFADKKPYSYSRKSLSQYQEKMRIK